jgi:hypothetical protein
METTARASASIRDRYMHGDTIYEEGLEGAP